MSNAAATLEVRNPAGRGLRVEFFRRGDRYAHVVSRLDGDLVVPGVESVEGTDADDWPPSPPLQQLSVETLPDGSRVALLVGMAGSSHWSLSVEAHAPFASLVFDVACRVKQLPAWMGSRYAPCSGEGREPLPIAVEMGSLKHDNGAEPGSFSIAGGEVAARFPQTIRWKYRLKADVS